ncbi:MAG: hypothetical protein ACJ8C4_19550 [Gemmataceae bacterium]
MSKAKKMRAPTYWSNGLARGYLFIGFCACVVLALSLNSRYAGEWAFLPSLVGAAGLAMRWPSAPVFVLLGTAIAVMITKDNEATSPETAEILMATSLVIYAVAATRLVGVTRSLWPPDARPHLRWVPPKQQQSSTAQDYLLMLTIVHPLWKWYRSWPAPPVGERRTAETSTPDEIVLGLIPAALAIAAAFVIWRLVGLVSPPLRMIVDQWRLGVVIWSVIITAIGVRVFIGYLSARRMSRDQAHLILTDTVWRETRREQQKIARWTAWRQVRHESREVNP